MIFKKKYKSEGFTPPDSKIYFKTIEIKTRSIVGKRLEQTLPNEDIRMTNEHIKRL